MTAASDSWRERGQVRKLLGHRIFTVDVPAAGGGSRPPLLVLHGFPTSSFDFHQVVDDLAADRRVLLFDMLGYGLSDKPDRAYGFGLQADLAAVWLAELGVDRVGLLTHDVGDTLGGELLARQLDGDWPVVVTDRVLVNGSIYVDLTELSVGQQFLLALPDRRLSAEDGPDRDTVMAGVAATFSPRTRSNESELDGQWAMISHQEGHLLLPRLIRYVEERRRSGGRSTGAIEQHPSPLTVVWGADDPIAVVAMADRLVDHRPGTVLHRLEGVGHYPMVEAPGRFVAAVTSSDR